MPPFALSFLLGFVTGLRAFIAPAAVSWAAFFGLLHLEGTHLAFMGSLPVAILFTLLAIAELLWESFPASAGNVRFPAKLILRMAMGALTGAVIGQSHFSNAIFLGMAFGLIGAIAGTFGGTAIREGLIKVLGKPLPATLAEDLLAILGGLLVLVPLR